MGEPITLTVTTYDGYEFSSLTVDGVDVTAGVTNGAYTFYMPDNDVTVSATFQFTGSSNAWAALQTLLDNASTEEDNPTVIPLTEDYTATNSDGPLKIPSGKYVTLDFAGHTIDRNLSSRTDNGSVIIVNGTLTVKDSGTGGTITGGNNNGNGGVYVANSGAFTMKGGSISGNSAYSNAGGVYVSGGTFNMTGGSISGNTAKYDGGGVYVGKYSTFFNLSGAPEITGNVKGGTIANGVLTGGDPNNVYLPSGITITVTGTLTNTTPVGVTMENPGKFTSGLSNYGTAENFASDNLAYRMGLNNGEAELYQPTFYTVSISDAENGTVTACVNGQTVTQAAEGDTVTLTATPATGYVLETLTVTQGDTPVKLTGNRFTMSAGAVTVTATFIEQSTAVKYLDENGAERYAPAQQITASTDVTTTPLTGWYCVKENVTFNDKRIKAGEGFKLILCDGAELIAKKGIHVPANSSLTVYAQSTGEGLGELTIDNVDSGNAGIGGNANESAGAGAITIVGGEIEVTGGVDGAGIGGGSGGRGGEITVTGGQIYANSFGPGQNGSGGILTMSLKDDKEYIYANSYGPSIFFVQVAEGCILKDNVNSKPYKGPLTESKKNAIAGRTLVRVDTNGKTLYEISTQVDPTFGGSLTTDKTLAEEKEEVTFTMALENGYVLSGLDATYNDDSGTNSVSDLAEGEDGNWSFTMPAADVGVVAQVQAGQEVDYLDENGVQQSVLAAQFKYPGGCIDNRFGWFYATEYVDMKSRWPSAQHHLRLILCDGATLIIPKGITVPEGSSLTIYAQSTGANMGKLIINGVDSGCAGIGGGENQSAGNITIVGGNITVTGGSGGAGIGGGTGGGGGNITILGGRVTVNGGSGAPGFGPGQNGSGGRLTMSLAKNTE